MRRSSPVEWKKYDIGKQGRIIVDLSDSRLAGNAKNGDKKSFDALYLKYKERIFNFIYRMIGNRETAEELAQETFVKAYISLQNYSERNTFSAWLYQIAANLAKNALRARGYRAHPSLYQEMVIGGETRRLIEMIASKSYNPEEIARSHELQEIVQKVLNALSAEHKMILVLCDVQGLSYEEAGRILHINTGTVASRLSRAREAFNRMLKREYDIDGAPDVP